ncbi:glycoside hydrolase family 5 protein [Martensiomyces pterosporus]|nr:glycoside hydrolase family 5 protein [Martensiomyces pterosporus]
MKLIHKLGAVLLALLAPCAHAAPTLAHLSKRFGKGGDTIRGVNLGGLFVLEPWIRPSLFKQWEEPYPQVVDEWSYCSALGHDECYSRLTQHWGTWVTEADIATLASLGINHIRIPIGYWAFTLKDGEPYVQGQLPFLQRILGWIGKYSLNAILDLHGAPGSQNGFDNSGRLGSIHWQDTQENIDRTIAALQGLASIAKQYPNVVDAIEAVNEPAVWGLSKQGIIDFYKRAYTAIRSIAPSVLYVIHDAFLSPAEWSDLNIAGWSNVILDTHTYHVFVKDRITLSRDGHLTATCQDAANVRSFNAHLWTVTGEWSLATTDCARWLNGFGKGARWDGTLSWEMNGPVYQGATCTGQNSIGAWDNATRTFFRQFAEAQMDAYEVGSGWIFWNFKTEDADDWNYIKLAQSGLIPNPPTDRRYSRYALDYPAWHIKLESPWCHE